MEIEEEKPWCVFPVLYFIVSNFIIRIWDMTNMPFHPSHMMVPLEKNIRKSNRVISNIAFRGPEYLLITSRC